MDTHFVSTFFGSGLPAEATIGDHQVVIDSTPEHGGMGTGPSPKRLMLASLAGCTGIDIVSILNKMKVSFSDLSINTEATLTETHPKTYNWVKVTYKVKLAENDRSKMEKAVALSEDKYCGVMAMFKTFANLEKEIVWL